MDAMIKQENFLDNLFSLYDETFENHHGIYLDNNTSLLTTLETISAQLEKYFLKQEVGKVDWGEIWRTVEKISPEDWETLKDKLLQTYTRLDKLFHDAENWNDEDTIGAALAIVVHTASHLGEIRQALCTLR